MSVDSFVVWGKFEGERHNGRNENMESSRKNQAQSVLDEARSPKGERRRVDSVIGINKDKKTKE